MTNLHWKVKVILCISAQDVVISQSELDTAYKLINDQLGNVSQQKFDELIEEFFNEDYVLEEYLLKINDSEDYQRSLDISYKSATSDGLDIRENLAFDKACKHWGETLEDYIEE